jgi:hypothetical protein
VNDPSSWTSTRPDQRAFTNPGTFRHLSLAISVIPALIICLFGTSFQDATAPYIVRKPFARIAVRIRELP